MDNLATPVPCAQEVRRRTVFEVEHDRRGRVWALFGLLVVVWLVPAVVLLAVASLVLYMTIPAASLYAHGLHWYHVAPTLAVALAGAAISWTVSRRDARGRLLRIMGGRPLDPGDRYHQRLANIVEEMRLASGEHRVEAVVVPSLGLNAFAFSDLHGGSVIGVSEGLVSGLPRAQLEGVVAHEFAHVLSRSHVTVTAACLLLGMWENVGDSIGHLGSSTGDASIETSASAGSALIGLIELAGSVVNAALSRQREYEADAAAVSYTRDPLALALALRTIARSPLGTGYVPPGLAAMCITAEKARLGSRTSSLIASHPPVEDRIAVLLKLANVGRGVFEAQAAEAVRVQIGSTHVVDAPAPEPAARLAAAATAAAAGAGPSAAPVTAAPSRVPAPPPVRSDCAPSRVVRGAGAACPACGAALSAADYEGVPVAVCMSCGGRLVPSADIARISARREVRFTPDQYAAAERVLADGNRLRREAIVERGRRKTDLRTCPICGRQMIRRHFDLDLAVEIDSCEECGVCWFDADELEVVQIVAERRGDG